MRRPIMAIGLILLAALALGPAQGGAAAPVAPQLEAMQNLAEPLQGKPALEVDAGDGVVFKIRAGQGPHDQKVTVLDKGAPVQDLEPGGVVAYARMALGATRYWVLSAYSGGAHCCGVYYVFSRAAPGQRLRFLGKTPGHNGGPMPLAKSFLYRDGRLYFLDLDNRFDYFHASHADSMLVNMATRYWRLAPTFIKVDNWPFAERYLEQAAGVDRQIQAHATARPRNPHAILQSGFQPGYAFMNFSDNLGQLLIKRTIYYLYAHEDGKAWQRLQEDVRKSYETDDWLPELKKEIEKILAQSPY